MDKILIIGPAWVGDMVMAQSLFKLCKQRNPDILLDVLAPAATLPLVNRMSEVDNALTLPFKHGEFNLLGRYRLSRLLKRKNYKQVIVLTNTWKSALIPFFAGIKKRTGWRGEMRYGLLNDLRSLDKARLPLMIERFMALGLEPHEPLPNKYPWPALEALPNECDKTLKRIAITLDERPVLVLCPGAEYGPAKRWPASYFAEVAQAKIAQGWQVWLMGGPKDKSVTTEIQSLCNQQCLDLAGKTSLTEAIDLLSLASLVISNDSGLMHMAAALRRPLIVLYGSTDPRHTPPLTDNVTILSLGLPCSPCFKRECPLGHLQCLKGLPSQQVLDAIEKMVKT